VKKIKQNNDRDRQAEEPEQDTTHDVNSASRLIDAEPNAVVSGRVAPAK
jgi:hypothetical protein